jgi:hypothetical protein
MTDLLFINKNVFIIWVFWVVPVLQPPHDSNGPLKRPRCIMTGVFISLKMHNENVSEKEPIFADAGVTKRALDA